MSRAKAVIYTRVSTDKQAEEGTSLEVQEAACLRKAQDLGAEVVDIITDEGVSGAFYLSRPGIQKALKLIEDGKANVLLTMKLDRSGRDADVLGLIRKRIVHAGAQLVFVDGMNFENNAAGTLMFRVNAGFAEYEKEVIRERTMSGKRKRAEQGQQPCRTFSPLGYHIVTKEDVTRGDYPAEQLGCYVVIEPEAAITRQLFAKFAGGASLRQLALWMNQQGIPTQRGGQAWYPSTLRFILTNTVYIGQPIFGRMCCRTDESRMEHDLKPEYHRRTSEAEQIKLTCDPIIERGTWDLCQVRLAENQQRLSGSSDRKRLFSGLVRCRVCKRAMASGVVGPKKYQYYHCCKSSPSSNLHRTPCARKWHRAEQMETLVLNTLLDLAQRPQRFINALQTFAEKEQQPQGNDMERLRRDLAALDQQEAATARAQVDALLKGRSTEVYDRLLTEIDDKRRALLALLADQEARETAPPMNYTTEGEKIAEVLRRFVEMLTAQELTTIERNGILSRFIRAIWPSEDGCEIDLRLPKSATVQKITTNWSSKREATRPRRKPP